MNKSYLELKHLHSFEERYEYLKMKGSVGADTFGFDRIFNQMFYRSKEWKDIRKYIISRDNGCDLGVDGYEIPSGEKVLIHHINPITMKDIDSCSEALLDPNNLITTSFNTHNAIHYGSFELIKRTEPIKRFKYDTCPWRNSK